jgi:hypothetical protein
VLSIEVSIYRPVSVVVFAMRLTTVAHGKRTTSLVKRRS